MDAIEKVSNKTRLIDADVLWRKLEDVPWYDNADRDEIALPLVDEASAVDAVEVVHGYWYEHYGIAICSHCQSMFDRDLKMLQVPSTYRMPNYCPNCGAKMDLED